jgi:UDP-N-acetylmuramate dehydrogenase
MTIIQEIETIPGCEYHRDYDLTGFTTIRLASKGDLVEVKNVSALKKLLPILKLNHRKYLVVGWGANQILPAICEDLIIHLDFDFDKSYFDSLKSEYHLPASVGLNSLTAHAVKFGLMGWEVFTGIPASLGGALFMNAGTNLGEIGKLVKAVQLITPEGELREEVITSESFSYRKNHFVKPGEIIVGATLVHLGIDPSISSKIKEYLDYRKKTQPLTTKNCGCVFKNPNKEMPAGKLIDLMGLKGLSVGGLRVSTKHANFIENHGSANWDQFEALVGIIQANINRFYGIEFELEVKIPYH